MDLNELSLVCREKDWKTELESNQTIRIFFHCNEKMSVSFLPGNLRCIVQIPCTWTAKLQAQFAFTTMNDGKILWGCSALDKLMQFAETADSLQCESASPARTRWVAKKKYLLSVDSTERLAFINGRVGQNILRDLLLAKYGSCMITHITEPELLVASHIKPWCECENDPSERLNENNVLLLSVALDKLFDAHYISFDSQTGKMLVSSLITEETLKKLGVYPQTMTLENINTEQSRFLKYHNMHIRK